MRFILIVVAALMVSPSVMSQTSTAVSRADLVKDVVEQIAGADKKSVEVILNDLNEFKGKIVAVDKDFFFLKSKKLKTSYKVKVVSIGNLPANPNLKRIKYSDVLQIEGKSVAISFVPDPAASPYSTWVDVRSISRGDFVQIHKTSGKTIHGLLYRSTADSLSLMRGNNELVIPASEIAKVYRVKGDTRSLVAKILTGGKLGAELADDGFDIWDAMFRFPLGVPVAGAVVIVAGVGVAITLYMLSIGKTQRILVYSR